MLDFPKKKQLSILVKIAMVDEEFAEEEKIAIQRVGQEYGATPEELEAIFNAPASDGLGPMTMEEKMDFMMDCMLVVLADDVISNAEDYFARHMAMRLGLKQEVVGFLAKNRNVNRKEMRDLMIPYFI